MELPDAVAGKAIRVCVGCDPVNPNLFSLGVVAFSLMLATACAPSKEGGGGGKAKGRIGTTSMDLTNPFFKLIANVMAEEAAKHGYELVALDGAVDAAKQNSQLADFAVQGYDAVFVNAVDSVAAGEGVKRLHAAGIPVFTFDIELADPETRAMVVSHIGSDNYQGGLLAAESMVQALGNRGKVAVIGYPETTTCIQRTKGFKDGLAKAQSPIQIVAELNGRANRNDGFSVANDILQVHPDLNGIFAINDPSALGAYAAVAKAGKANQITIVAFDASPAGKQGVFEKKLYDTPQQFPRKMALGTVEAFLKHLEGETVEKKIFIPCAHYRYDDSVKDESRVNEQW